jgi:hypothetical protein
MKHFSINELIATNTGLPNIPMQPEKDNLIKLVDNILDPLRELYGKPIHINSGYRSPAVNKKIGGVSTSQHVEGKAADITAGSKEENEKLFNLISDKFIFDQLIDEKNFLWIHVSFSDGKNRMQRLEFKDNKYINI